MCALCHAHLLDSTWFDRVPKLRTDCEGDPTDPQVRTTVETFCRGAVERCFGSVNACTRFIYCVVGTDGSPTDLSSSDDEYGNAKCAAGLVHQVMLLLFSLIYYVVSLLYFMANCHPCISHITHIAYTVTYSQWVSM